MDRKTQLEDQLFYALDVEDIRAALDAGVDVNAVYSCGGNVKARQHGMGILYSLGHNHHDRPDRLEMAKVLLDAGADVNQCDAYGETPLHSVGNVAMAKLYIEHGANVNAACVQGNTPLLMCGGNPGMAQVYVKAGANINHQNDLGNSILHQGTTNPEDYLFLLQSGADPSLKNRFGKTPAEKLLGDKEFECLAVLSSFVRARDQKAAIGEALAQGAEAPTTAMAKRRRKM